MTIRTAHLSGKKSKKTDASLTDGIIIIIIISSRSSTSTSSLKNSYYYYYYYLYQPTNPSTFSLGAVALDVGSGFRLGLRID